MAGITGVAGGSRPDAVAGWSAACDLELAYGQGNGPATLGVGGYMNIVLAGNETTYRSISPTRQITSACCPLRIVGSSAEDTSASGPGLNVAQYTGMVAAAQAVGVPVVSRIFTSQVHALFCSPSLSGPDFNGADDVAGTARWFTQLVQAPTTASNRTVATRTRATGRTVAA